MGREPERSGSRFFCSGRGKPHDTEASGRFRVPSSRPGISPDAGTTETDGPAGRGRHRPESRHSGKEKGASYTTPPPSCSVSVGRLLLGLAVAAALLRRVCLGAAAAALLRRVCLLGATAAATLGNNLGLSSLTLGGGSRLICIATATYHGNRSDYDDQRENLFHSFYN